MLYCVWQLHQSLMSGDTGHAWSYHGCMWRDVNRETWVDLSSSNGGSSVMNDIIIEQRCRLKFATATFRGGGNCGGGAYRMFRVATLPPSHSFGWAAAQTSFACPQGGRSRCRSQARVAALFFVAATPKRITNPLHTSRACIQVQYNPPENTRARNSKKSENRYSE